MDVPRGMIAPWKLWGENAQRIIILVRIVRGGMSGAVCALKSIVHS
jgi:hypothetical protein